MSANNRTLTISERLAIAYGQRLAAEAETYRREQDRAAQTAVDAVLARIRQHDTGGCDALTDATPKPVPRWLFWTFVCAFSLVMTFASYEFVRVLPVLREWLP